MAEASDDACLQVDEMGSPLYFQNYVKSPCYRLFDTKIEYWVLWNADNEEPEHPAGFPAASSKLREKIRVILKKFMNWNATSAPSILIQFWEPVLIEGRTLLTTRHQPFAINSIQEGLCRYRIRSEMYKVDVDEGHNKDELGYLGRVFIHKLPEVSPNIEYYTVKEYPQRQHALDCQITCVNAFPVFDPSGQSCIGVLEVAWSRETASIGDDIPSYYWVTHKDIDLKILGVRNDCFDREIRDDYGASKVAKKMGNALKNICEAHKLHLAQMWAVCSDCMSNASYTGQVISRRWLLSYVKGGEGCSGYYPNRFQSISGTLHLRDGQGVVGQALSSHGLIFCPDITQFSIVEYPLAHFAKLCGLQSCFAICLQSSTHARSHVYVLEFFLPSSPIVIESVINLLRNILCKMKLHFKTFKLASGKDLWEKLPIQFVDYRNGEKYCYATEVESQIATSAQSPPGTLQDKGKIVQQDPSSQQSIDKVANAEQSSINCTSSHGSNTPKNLERAQSKTGIQLGLNDILPHAKRKIVDDAEALNVNRSTFKRIRRGHDINSRPSHNMKETCPIPQADDDGQQILHSSDGLASSFNQVLPKIAPSNSHDTSTSNVNFVNVKAEHIDDIIKFKLLLSSGLVELQDEIAKRLKLTSGTYNIKYKDEENELVSITCDEDVQFWIHTCGSGGSNSLKVIQGGGEVITQS